jgi:DnaD/phage-associated family protein
MKEITLDAGRSLSYTLLSDLFVDRYMPSANGEYVKIYIYLLRAMQNHSGSFTVSAIADVFSCTERDVLRALTFWEKEGLLAIRKEHGEIVSVSMTGETGDAHTAEAGQSTASGNQREALNRDAAENSTQVAPSAAAAQSKEAATGAAAVQYGEIARGNASGNSETRAIRFAETGEAAQGDTGSTESYASQNETGSAASNTAHQSGHRQDAAEPKRRIPTGMDHRVSNPRRNELLKEEEIRELITVAETYLGTTLGVSDISRLLYLYDELHLSLDLLDYLIESCVARGKRSVRYIEAVGIQWYNDDIKTVPQAKQQMTAINPNHRDIMRALSLGSRKPLPSECESMDRWLKDYGFGLDLIKEACTRALAHAENASPVNLFRYADAVLTRWHKEKITTPEQLRASDEKFRREHAASSAKQQQKPRQGGRGAQKNNFNNFSQRTYDFEQLERTLRSKGNKDGVS